MRKDEVNNRACEWLGNLLITRRLRMNPLRILIPALALSIFPLGVSAQVATEPVGFFNLSIPAATSSTSPSYTVVSIPLLDATSANGATIGTITSVASATVSNSNAGWTASAFSNAATPCYVRITSGTAKGRSFMISTTTANTATDLYVDNQNTDLTTLGIVAGDTYRIYNTDTLSSLFGTSLQGGNSADVADNVWYWTGVSWQIFYYNSTRTRWEIKDIQSSANDVALRPDTGLMIVRRAQSSLTLQITGAVPTTDVQSLLNNSGSTFLSSGFPVDVTLNSLSLNTLPGWTSNATASQADIVMYWTGSSWLRFFYTGTQWEAVGISGTSANSFSISAGKAIMISKVGSASGGTVYKHTIPYTL